jgi:hypothetical protein
MARKSRSRKSSSSRKMGSTLKSSSAKGVKLISIKMVKAARTLAHPKGRRVYVIKGQPGRWFAKLGHAKTAANKIAYK